MNKMILVVDDEKIIRVTVSKILEVEGYDVLTAENGTEALSILEEKDIDLILLDICMPDIDGIEVMQKAGKISPETEVVLLTGHGSLESAIDALRYKAHDYLLKPISSQEILSSVASALALQGEQKQKRILLGQLESSLQQLKDVEGVSELAKSQARIISLPDGVQADMARRELWRGNNKISLTPTEGKLMRVFVENWGRVMTHEELVFLVQGYEVAEWEAPEVLRPLISRLRRKLSEFPDGEKWISSIRGTGYVFDADMP
ncbi:MAG: response regulator transcription factor [Chloroflexota bacterium]|nr:response regulator transcription factor [Chloroflexota bacterium]